MLKACKIDSTLLTRELFLKSSIMQAAVTSSKFKNKVAYLNFLPTSASSRRPKFSKALDLRSNAFTNSGLIFKA